MELEMIPAQVDLGVLLVEDWPEQTEANEMDQGELAQASSVGP